MFSSDRNDKSVFVFIFFFKRTTLHYRGERNEASLMILIKIRYRYFLVYYFMQ